MTRPSINQTTESGQGARDAHILAVWLTGRSDTMDLAERFGISEVEAYRIIAARPRSGMYRPKVAYAGASGEVVAP